MFLLLIYFFIPAFFGYLLFLNENPAACFKYRRLAMIGVNNWLEVVILGLVSLLYLLAAFSAIGLSFNRVIGYSILVAICVVSFFYISIRFGLYSIYFKNKALVSFLIGVIALIVVSLAKVLASKIILEYTQVAAKEFPEAQVIIFLCLLPALWLIIISFAGVVLAPLFCLIYMFFMFYMDWRADVAMKSKYSTMLTLRRGGFLSEISKLCPILAAFFSSVIFLEFVSVALKPDNYEGYLKELIVFASFDLKPSSCGMKMDEEEYMLAPVGSREAVLASPDMEKKYIFKRVKCSFNY